MLYIIAGSAKQADDYCRSIGLNKNDFIYVHSPQVLYGAKNIEFSRIGTWYERDDIYDMNRMLILIGSQEIYGVKTLKHD